MITYHPLSESIIAGAVALQRACFPPPFPEDLLWQPHHLLQHLEVFPEGQFAALDGEKVVASCTNLRVSDAAWDSHLDWMTTTGGPTLAAHTPAGGTLYGVDISVHPDYRGRGIARTLYQMRYDLVCDMALARYGTACRMPDYAASGMVSVADFAAAVARGDCTDRTLTPLLKMGLVFEGIIENYMDDEESGNAGAILSWKP
jgi:ribosomal protein S18 acetylase RimI-like enzyme